MRFEDVELRDFDEYDYMDGVGTKRGAFRCYETDEQYDIANKIRANEGYTDLATDDENDSEDLFYSFYLSYDIETKEVDMWFIVHNGEKDDGDIYYDYITLSLEEKELLMFKIIKRLIDDIGILRKKQNI